jgi:DoxX-like protein
MSRTSTTKYANVALWIAQSLLAAAFLFAGAMKLIMPIGLLEQQAQLPGAFLRFIACAEILGALGLVLPGIFRVRTELTSLAATGLVLIMTGATVIGIERGQIGGSIMPFILGVIAAFIAAKRSEWKTVSEPVRKQVLRKAA